MKLEDKMPTLILRPNAAGDLTEITSQAPSGEGYHWDKVAEVTSDEYGSYVWTSTGTYETDLYTLEDTSQTGTINWIKVWIRCNCTALVDYGATVIKTGGVVYNGFNNNLVRTWTNYSTQYTTNPEAGGAWTWTQLNALQAGVRLAELNTNYVTYCTQVYVEVNYNLPIYELSCSDGLKSSDVPTTQCSFQCVVADGLKGGDSIQHNCPDVADGVKLSDALIDNIIFNSVSASDGILLGDATSTHGLYALLLIDGLKISDSILHDYITNPTLIDGVKLSESLSTLLQTYPTIIDGVKLSEVLTTLKETFPTLIDGAKLSDAAVHYLTLSLLATDGVKLTDSAIASLFYYLSVSDGVKLSDLASIYKVMVIYALLELYGRVLIARLHKRDTTVIQEE